MKNVYWRDERNCGVAKLQIMIVTTSGASVDRVSGELSLGEGSRCFMDGQAS